MNIQLQAHIAYALFVARWRQSVVATLGVTFGIGIFVAMLAFMTGLNNLLDGLILNRIPHIRIFKEISPSKAQPIKGLKDYAGYQSFVNSVRLNNSRLNIYNAPVIINSLDKDKRIHGCAPRLAAPVLFQSGTINIQGIANGIDAFREIKLFSFADYVIEGSASSINDVNNSIILGKGLAQKMRLHVSDMINITTVEGGKYSMKITGIFQSGFSDFDNSQSYTSLRTAQKILNKSPDYITDIAIKLANIDNAPKLTAEYRKLYESDVEDIQTANAEFETGSRVRLIISYAVGTALLIVAGFGIYNILNMLMYEKMDTIALLKATGFSGADIKRIFLTIALTTGVIGAIAGCLLGFLLSLAISYIPFETTAFPTIKTYPVYYSVAIYIIAVIFSIFATAMAGWFPASKAGKLDPVKIIRGR